MIVVLTGAPGAGKGTQADLLTDKAGYRKISTGDALRRQIKLGTDVGLKARSFMDEGRLVPDDVLFGVLKAELGEDASENILLDGYPRNVKQAETLKEISSVNPVRSVVNLAVDEKELMERLCGRRVCQDCGASFHVMFKKSKVDGVCDRCNGNLIQRPDDNEEKVRVRLEVYEKETRPVLDFYRQEGLLREIDGAGDAEEIFLKLQEAIESGG